MSFNSSTSSDTFYEWTSCARTLPFTHFPGIKRAVRLESGIRVHFPVVPEVSTTTPPASTFRPLAASTPTIVIKEENLRQLQQQAGTDEDAAKSGSALGLAFVHQVHDEILLTEIPEANNNHLVVVMRTRSAGTLRASAAAGLVTPVVSAGRLTANINPDDETARHDPTQQQKTKEKRKAESETITCCKCTFAVRLEESMLMSLHLKQVHQEGLFVCGGCPGEFFYHAHQLKNHLKSHHSQDERLRQELQDQVNIMSNREDKVYHPLEAACKPGPSKRKRAPVGQKEEDPTEPKRDLTSMEVGKQSKQKKTTDSGARPNPTKVRKLGKEPRRDLQRAPVAQKREKQTPGNATELKRDPTSMEVDQKSDPKKKAESGARSNPTKVRTSGLQRAPVDQRREKQTPGNATELKRDPTSIEVDQKSDPKKKAVSGARSNPTKERISGLQRAPVAHKREKKAPGNATELKRDPTSTKVNEKSDQKKKADFGARSKQIEGRTSAEEHRGDPKRGIKKYTMTIRPTLECDFCDQKFVTFDKRDDHYKKYHGVRRPWKQWE